MVPEILIGRLGEHSLLPDIVGQIAVALGNGITGSLGKIAQGDRAAPG